MLKMEAARVLGGPASGRIVTAGSSYTPEDNPEQTEFQSLYHQRPLVALLVAAAIAKAGGMWRLPCCEAPELTSGRARL